MNQKRKTKSYKCKLYLRAYNSGNRTGDIRSPNTIRLYSNCFNMGDIIYSLLPDGLPRFAYAYVQPHHSMALSFLL